jgi:hypothetical protein
VAEVDEVAGREVCTEAVVPDGGGADPVGAEGEHVGHRTFGFGRRVEAGGGEDQAVHPAALQGLHGDALGVGIVLRGGHDREQSAGAAGAGDLLVEHGHHGVGEPGDDDADRAGAGPP